MSNKTTPTDASVEAFVAAVPNEARREDAQTLLRLLSDVSGEAPRMWGPTIVGFGTYDYTYDSGRSGKWLRIGFSPRKRENVVYLMGGFEQHTDLLSRLGKYKTGKSCLYISRLANVDLDVLRELMVASLAEMAEKYPSGA
ncbi:MAG: DUF1801 domain-containing protein [Deltaproteobacteria bacterium]|nr:MAG: DUF1801 domain-containing protein [Deltaproteobacteria bacterium]